MSRSGLTLCVQYASTAPELPARAQLRRWAEAAHPSGQRAEITLRYVDLAEGRALNRDFRGRDYATNVLTFNPDPALLALQGLDYAADIVVCAPVIAREAREQGKPLRAHHAHMLLHGLLHAQGYEHEDALEAEAMEALERALLRRFRIADPYADPVENI